MSDVDTSTTAQASALDTGLGLPSVTASAASSLATSSQLDRTPPGQDVAASAASVAATASDTASAASASTTVGPDGEGEGMTNAQLGIYAGVSE